MLTGICQTYIINNQYMIVPQIEGKQNMQLTKGFSIAPLNCLFTHLAQPCNIMFSSVDM